MKLREFQGKNVYITGGSSGIGLETAKLVAARGANVILFARGRERLEEARRAVETARKDSSQNIDFRQLDVGSHEDVERVMAAAVREFGPPDVLINSAGRAYPDYFRNISYEQFDETMKVHIYGIWNTVSALLPYLAQRQGYVVNVSSSLGVLGVFGYTDYCASKYAIVGLSEVLKSELKPEGVGVSVLLPVDTDTPGFEVENRRKPPECVAVSEGAGLMQPGEVARLLLKGLAKGRFLIMPGSMKGIYYIKRFAPRLVDAVMDHQIKKVRKEAMARKGTGP